MHQCGSALHHLHSLPTPVIHRDVKPANILFRREDGNDVVKLADFGISAVLSTDVRDTAVGTPLFIAPEVLARKPHTTAVDVFSLGLIYLGLVTLRPGDDKIMPFSGTLVAIVYPYVIIEDFQHTKVLSFSETSINSKTLVPVGKEMYESNMKRETQPVVVSQDPRDNKKMTRLKQLINCMVVLEPQKRLKMKEVLNELEKITRGWPFHFMPRMPVCLHCDELLQKRFRGRLVQPGLQPEHSTPT